MSIVPRVACINDMSGFGRCSLTTAIAVLSSAGVQACPVPTAILSKHTGFASFSFMDFTCHMDEYLNDWKNIKFDCIYTGFLGSATQIDIVEKFISTRRQKDNSFIIIDPVMGDQGKLYSTYSEDMRVKMKQLISKADIITPNITEACFLTDTEYTGDNISEDKVKALASCLSVLGCKNIVLTGIRKENSIINMTMDEGNFYYDEIPRSEIIFSGTGDIFASVVCAYVIKGVKLRDAVKKAGQFISSAIEYTVKSNLPIKNGVVFEPLLFKLEEI